MRPVLTFCESFLREMLLSYRSAKVSPSKISCYTVPLTLAKKSTDFEGCGLHHDVPPSNNLYVCIYRRMYLGVTVLDSEGARVIVGSLIEQLHTVLLGSEGRGEMDGDHLQHGISSRKPFPHHGLQQRGKII